MGSASNDSGWESWQYVYQHGVLVLLPPAEIRESVDRLRERYDPVSHGYSAAHITLTGPLRVPATDAVLERLTAVVGRTSAFRVTYGPLRSFLPSPVLWLEVQPLERILDLRRELHATGLFDLSLPHTEDFVPHMTITEGLSGPAVDNDLFQALRGEFTGGSFECTRVTLLKPDGDFRFAAERGFRLHDP